MYDLAFVFEECGFNHIPDYINRGLLFNVSFEIGTGEIKLYILDKNKRFLYKASHEKITRQYSGDDPEYGGSPSLLMEHFGCKLDFNQIVIDAVEGDTYYLYLDDASVNQGQRLFDAVNRIYGISEDGVLDCINTINQCKFVSLGQALSNRAVSLVRIPLSNGQVKIYARPFLNYKGYELDECTLSFLSRLYNSERDKLPCLLTHAWVAQELLTGRQLIVTQHHALLHEL